MGALTITTDPGTPTSMGNKRFVTGTLTFSSSYATGGDTFDPAQMKLVAVESMVCLPANSVDDTPFIARPQMTGIILSTLASGGSPTGKVGAYAVQDPMPAANIGATAAGLLEVDNGTDLSGFSCRFIASGV